MVSDIVTITALPPDDIESYVAALPAAEVVAHLHLVTESRRQLYEAEKMLRSRIAAEQILSPAEVWTSPDGRDFMWGGDRERVCSDPAALRTALEELPLNALARAAMREAFKEQPLKIYLTHLDRIEKFGGPEAGQVIRSFVVWKEGAPKLRALDEGGR